MENYFSQIISNDMIFNPFRSIACATNEYVHCEQCLETFKCAKGLEIHVNKIHS